ncbi:MAG: hypothetical protein WBP22_02780 [Candidatus Saccharimonas sp.]
MQSSFALTGMRTLGKRVVLILAALALILGAASFSQEASAAPAAQAAVAQQGVATGLAAKGPACDWSLGFVCGYLKNTGKVGIGIIGSWGQSYSKILQPGEASTKYFQDTDGFYIGPGYCARTSLWVGRAYKYKYYGSGNHKINDAANWNISAYRC